MKTELCCPSCFSSLTRLDELIKCPSCGCSWPMRDGVPDFLEEDFYFGEIPRDEMKRLNARVREVGSRRALEEVLGATNPWLMGYAIDDSRADWRFLAPLTSESVVLDLGSGWGTLAVPIARECAEVVAVEATWERLEFMRLRAAEEGINNILAVRANVLSLPFAPNSFDLAVMNGILEWVGMWDSTGSPMDAQEKFLRRVHNLLKPNGCLYIGIENRFGIDNWMGRPDHSGLPFTSLVPRWMADIIVRMRSRTWRTARNPKRYRTYTYSWIGYRKMLERCGFDGIEIYVPIPGYNKPNYLFPLDAPNAAAYCLREALAPVSRRRRLAAAISRAALRLKLDRLLYSDFCLYARAAK